MTSVVHRFAVRRWPVRMASVLLCGSCAVISPVLWSQQAISQTIHHRIMLGDTLEQLAMRYLGDASQWPQLQAHNGGIDPYRLPPGAVLEIPLQLLRAASASVQHLQGSASLSRTGMLTTTGVQRGQMLREGDRLQLSLDAFITVRLADGSTVRVQSSSELEMVRLRRRGRVGSLQSVLELHQGGVEIQVPGGVDTTRRLDVLTPVATTSVRGTHFEVQLDAQGTVATAVDSGKVLVQGREVRSGYGVTVDNDGRTMPPALRLPAPDAARMPVLAEDAQWLTLPLPTVENAVAWRVHLSSDKTGLAVLRGGLFHQPLARFEALPDGLYHLQVRVVDARGISGYAVQVPLRIKAHPVAPLAQSPAPGAVVAQGDGWLQCTPVDGVQAYQLQVVALPPSRGEVSALDFRQPLLNQEILGACSLDVSHLPVGTYAWRSASIRKAGEVSDRGPFSAGQVFRVALRPSAPAMQDIQTNNAGGAAHVFWPGDAGQRFRLQAFVSAQAATTGTEPVLDTVLDGPRWMASGLPAGIWHIRIQVQDPSGLHSAFSPSRTITVLPPLVLDGNSQPVMTGFGTVLRVD